MLRPFRKILSIYVRQRNLRKKERENPLSGLDFTLNPLDTNNHLS